jgi:hypothetical protein
MELERFEVYERADGTFSVKNLPEVTEVSPEILTTKLDQACNIVVAFRFHNGHANYRVVGWDPDAEALVIQLVYGEIAGKP